MTKLHSKFSASISELKKSPSNLLKQAGNEPIAILNHNTPSAYLVPSQTYEKMMDMLEEYMLAETVKERLASDETPVEVDLDEL